MKMHLGPTVADLKRAKDFTEWRDSMFSAIAKALGPSDSHGARRHFGDFEFICESVDVGAVLLWFATRAHMPMLHAAVRVRWEAVTPAQAASAILAKHRAILSSPIYVFTKRAQSHAEVD